MKFQTVFFNINICDFCDTDLIHIANESHLPQILFCHISKSLLLIRSESIARDKFASLLHAYWRSFNTVRVASQLSSLWRHGVYDLQEDRLTGVR
jgi:hypothetical protein